MAVLISGALTFGNVNTSAWSATDASGATEAHSVQTGDSVNNQAPLPPAGAAGIKQAQGLLEEHPLLTVAIVAGIVAIVWILLDDDDEAPDTIPITHSN